jgi:hypothetical protein
MKVRPFNVCAWEALVLANQLSLVPSTATRRRRGLLSTAARIAELH